MVRANVGTGILWSPYWGSIVDRNLAKASTESHYWCFKKIWWTNPEANHFREEDRLKDKLKQPSGLTVHSLREKMQKCAQKWMGLQKLSVCVMPRERSQSQERGTPRHHKQGASAMTEQGKAPSATPASHMAACSLLHFPSTSLLTAWESRGRWLKQMLRPQHLSEEEV